MAETGKDWPFLITNMIYVFRWIIYNPKHGADYDASMVPAEWFGWLHYKTDKTPVEKVSVIKQERL